MSLLVGDTFDYGLEKNKTSAQYDSAFNGFGMTLLFYGVIHEVSTTKFPSREGCRACEGRCVTHLAIHPIKSEKHRFDIRTPSQEGT
ncbi:hypothetical protein [Fodinibius sp. AD559]|uniref:hypothetical protein n=1 Tax=Fodinibius sp. AD559 TaxID=3424179 RepID=UPI004046FCBC